MDKEQIREDVTKRIKLWGIVQGIGFRPFVAKLADSCSVMGWVKNKGGFVEILVSGSKQTVDDFVNGIFEKKPVQSSIVRYEIENTGYQPSDAFRILSSDDISEGAVFIPADLSVCDKCLAEMRDADDRRYRHPFISCMDCGPRYSIIDTVPYDRCNTSMNEFPMCIDCNKEYTDRSERRYHAQTVSCKDCGPFLIFAAEGRDECYREEALKACIDALKAGGIAAIKGIGGYHLSCSPFDEAALMNLRKIKGREAKPFAVMFPSLSEIEKYCCVSSEERELLISAAKPIVLLKRKTDTMSIEVYKTSRHLGAFLPYTPLQQLLLDECGPLVMTSANIQDAPIIKDDEKITMFSGKIDGILYNKRDIRVSLDDSVIKAVLNKTQMIRRARGFSPLPIYINGIKSDNAMVFAAGGQLKSAFCLTNGGFAYMSQHFGDMDSISNLEVYSENYRRMCRLLKIKPQLAVCDLHPDYATANFAEMLGLPLIRVQHHHAHIASVIAEHGLINEPVVGVSFDGTGYGTDGGVWGSEFLICSGDSFKRVGHLKTLAMLGGDESMKQAWKSLYCFLTKSGIQPEDNDSPFEIIKSAIDNKINTVSSSSMGRLFDAVSALLNICDYNRYEGECAAMLENSAAEAIEQSVPAYPLSFDIAETDGVYIADYRKIFYDLQKGINENTDKRSLALGFHEAVADMILNICIRIKIKTAIKTAALSGGVFQNSVLLKSAVKKLEAARFQVYFNSAVPANDGGIALGQAYLGLLHLQNV